jgi:hypothetical protein
LAVRSGAASSRGGLCQAQMEGAHKADGVVPRERLAELRDAGRTDLKDFAGCGGSPGGSSAGLLEIVERRSRQRVR